MLKKTEQTELREVLLSERGRLITNAKDGLRSSMDRYDLNVGRDSIDESMEEEILSTQLRLRDREKFLLHKIEAALDRLDKGLIDECDECGEKISFRRLLARPTTTLCIDCKEEKEKNEQSRTQTLGSSGMGMESMGDAGEEE